MARKPPKPCRYPGCSELAHRPRRTRGQDSARWHKLYLTRLWREELRPGQLLREPWCRECARRGLRTPATDVDHVRPHRGDWALFSDPANLQSLCHGCHSRKTLAENRGKPEHFSGL